MIKELKVDELHAHPENPRKDLGDLTELTESIRKNGIYQNLTVVPRDEGGYTVIIGHRRLAAAKAAGLDTVPCVIAKMDPVKQLETMLIENMQRADLTYYEQAVSFQMMLDLGSDVETISEKTGFSKTTVRRRVKMAELDRKKMQELSISGRQITLADFDRLFEVKNPEERNRLLVYIGTSNFGYQCESVLNGQKAKENLPRLMKDLEKAGAKKISMQESWSGAYRSKASIFLAKYGEDGNTLPDVQEPLFYRDDIDQWANIYVKSKKETAPKKTKAQIEKEKKVKAAWEELAEFGKTALACRQAFVKKLKMTKDNKERILAGAAIAVICRQFTSPDLTPVMKALGIDYSDVHYAKRNAMIIERIGEIHKRLTPEMVYEMLGDVDYIDTQGYGKDDYPRFTPHYKMQAIYAWLESVGYEPSDEEKAVLSGRSPLFHVGEE